MDYKMISVWMFAVACSYLIFSMPMAFASEVKIYNSGGQVSATTQISPSSLVNKQVVILHDESDSTWTNKRFP